MKKINKTIAKAIKNIASTMADFAYGSASAWGMHQMKEPKRVTNKK